jgi:hypothetical protein
MKRYEIAIASLFVCVLAASGCLSRPKLTEAQISKESLGTGITLEKLLNTDISKFHPPDADYFSYTALSPGTGSVSFTLKKYGEECMFHITRLLDDTPGKTGKMVSISVMLTTIGKPSTVLPGLNEGLKISSPESDIRRICGAPEPTLYKMTQVYQYKWVSSELTITTLDGNVDLIVIRLTTGNADFQDELGRLVDIGRTSASKK